jgi:hypothetical protein
MRHLDAASKTPSRRNTPLEPLGRTADATLHNQVDAVTNSHGHRRPSVAVPTSHKTGAVPHPYSIGSQGEAPHKRLNSLVLSNRSSSITSGKADWRRRTTKLQQQPPVFNDTNDDREDGAESSESSEDDGVAQGVAEVKHRRQFFKSLVGPTAYEDGGVVTKGQVDHRGITPHVVFSTSQTPPSEAKNSLVTSSQPVTCGFCSSTNLLWVLRCSFCGSARMSDAPRLKYLIDMILSIDPRIKPDKVLLCSSCRRGLA